MTRKLSEERIKGNKLRDKVLARDNCQCRVCSSREDLEVHHMQALVYGGKSVKDNLITYCKECHKYAPDDGVEANMKYIKERNKVIYEQLISYPKPFAMMMVIYMEFLKARVDEYVQKGYITDEQKEKILLYEENKLY